MTPADRINRHFAERLLAIRSRAEMLPAELAARAGMTALRVNRIENANTTPSIGEAVLLAAALGVSPSELFGQLIEVADVS